MSHVVSLLLNGLSVGSVYALIALGMVLVYKATEIINFAHPGILVLGTFVATATRVHLHWPFALAVLAGIATGALAGAVVLEVLVRPFLRRDAVLAAGIMTIGLSILLNSLTNTWIGSQVLSLRAPFGSSTLRLLGVSVPVSRVAAFCCAALLLLALHLWLHRTPFGLEMRAAAEDAETAEMVGIRLSRVALVAWSLAGAVAVVAGIFLVSYPTAGLDVTATVVALQAIPAVVIGGIDSTTGAVVGGLAVGLVQTFALGYQAELDFLGRNFATAAPYLLMLLVLLVRPAGLFGQQEAARV
ncbi:branched-chain amino acid ABC transporter permease [Nocardioides sp. GXZ039]|uniref:branched-chain amino acid ABC transporter permease n=1 Tax=Nocardioides sp. GXZ039 TaxID=3136018 RepID=UPI0030F4A7FA